MPRPLFVVPVAELERGDRTLTWEIPVSWLEDVFTDTEAEPRSDGQLEATFSKSGREVMVRGTLRSNVTMPCSRTLDPVALDLEADVFLMLHPPAGAEPAPRSRPGRRRRKGRKKRAEAESLSREDAAQDQYDGEQVVLDDFVREFLLLELPLVPLRPDLRSDETPAIDPPPRASEDTEGESAVDPRLAPLAALAERLRQDKE